MGARCYQQGQAREFPDKDVYVASGTNDADHDNMRFFGHDIVDVVLAEKARGRTSFLFGGGVLVSSFLAMQAVDEMLVGVVPVLLGSGRPLFCGGYPAQELTLADYSVTWGKVRLRYVRRYDRAGWCWRASSACIRSRQTAMQIISASFAPGATSTP